MIFSLVTVKLTLVFLPKIYTPLPLRVMAAGEINPFPGPFKNSANFSSTGSPYSVINLTINQI